jgi:undecaprenyl-diphosphatase
MLPPEHPSLLETIALGLLQGPAELLPISSSAHVELVPWLLGWRHAGLPGEVRKEVEVALHAGTALALLAAGEWRARQWLGVLALGPPAVAAMTLERAIETRLGGPGSVAAGLIAGGLAMAAADGLGPPPARRPAGAGIRDALWLGAAQASALIPGVSRSGMTRAAARARGFDRASAAALSREVALPVLIGAAALKGVRLLQRRPGRETVAALVAGTAAAAASSTVALRAERALTGRMPYAAWAAYRVGVAAVILAVRQNRSRT